MQRTLPEGYEAYDATQTARQAVPPPMEPVPPGAEGWEILAHGNDRKTPLVGDNSGIGSFVVNKKRLTMTLMRSSSPFYAWLLIGLFFITNACARQIVGASGRSSASLSPHAWVLSEVGFPRSPLPHRLWVSNPGNRLSWPLYFRSFQGVPLPPESGPRALYLRVRPDTCQ